ncbi:hypothetical protein Glove_401g9 [Diversispora epigaea]|uniref:Uncharacterized protein n=1 Tax=Diversispora epigaea TaxID=1348612 RepID=A0A397H0L9_9GLOM|nr:hypothetical protein Glove_401g9 [Diversispora epigaea]
MWPLCRERKKSTIIKNFNDDVAKNKKFTEICIEKKLLLTKPNGYSFPDCRKSVETITEATTTETDLGLDSESSTLSIVGKVGKQLNIQSQEIIDEEMLDADNGKNKDNDSKGKGIDMAEGSNKRPIEVSTEETTTMQNESSSKKQGRDRMH